MRAAYHSIDLARFALRPGEGRRLDAGGRSRAARARRRALRGRGRRRGRLGSTSRAPRRATRCGCGSRPTSPGPACAASRTPDLAVEVDAREVDQPGTRTRSCAAPTSKDDELDLGSGPTTPWRLRCPSSLSAGPTAGACARSAARPSTTPTRTQHRHEPGARSPLGENSANSLGPAIAVRRRLAPARRPAGPRSP